MRACYDMAMSADLGYSEEDLDLIADLKPGTSYDGGVRTKTPLNAYRFNQNGTDRQELYRNLLHLLQYKVDKNLNQAQTTELLQLLREEWSFTPQFVRDNIPTSYSSMLNALHQSGFPEIEYVDYWVCPCGFIWRGDWKPIQGDKQLDRKCPVQNCPYFERDRMILHYQPLADWIRRMFANAELAQQLGSWPSRRRADNTAADVYDGEFFSRMCEEGRTDQGDPR